MYGIVLVVDEYIKPPCYLDAFLLRQFDLVENNMVIYCSYGNDSTRPECVHNYKESKIRNFSSTMSFIQNILPVLKIECF